MRSLRGNRTAALSAGAFITVIISIVIGLAFFVIVPGFVVSAVDNLSATDTTTATILNLIPFVLGALFIAYPVSWLVKELRDL